MSTSKMTLTEYFNEIDPVRLGRAEVILSKDEFKIINVREIPRLGHVYMISVPQLKEKYGTDGIFYTYDYMSVLFTTCDPDDGKGHSCFYLPCKVNELMPALDTLSPEERTDVTKSCLEEHRQGTSIATIDRSTLDTNKKGKKALCVSCVNNGFCCYTSVKYYQCKNYIKGTPSKKGMFDQ